MFISLACPIVLGVFYCIRWPHDQCGLAPGVEITVCEQPVLPREPAPEQA